MWKYTNIIIIQGCWFSFNTTVSMKVIVCDFFTIEQNELRKNNKYNRWYYLEVVIEFDFAFQL